MKKINLISSLLFLLFMNLSLQSQHASNGFYNTFYVGILDNGRQQYFPTFDGLNLNVWFHYNNWWCLNATINDGWTDLVANDLLLTPVSEYQNGIIGVLSNNSSHLVRTISDRIKLAYLMLGQRCEYACLCCVGSSSPDTCTL